MVMKILARFAKGNFRKNITELFVLLNVRLVLHVLSCFLWLFANFRYPVFCLYCILKYNPNLTVISKIFRDVKTHSRCRATIINKMCCH